ncbi:MAG: methionyl-tRNA formyltransferase, partial [Armatimonadota bacterium]|nr:methionyl-tRNA formyltransferase [Armatimonadota bacterium]
IKQLAMDKGLPVFQPPTLKRPENAEEVTALQSDVICVAAYGLILPGAVLAAPTLGCVNVHASLLPRYRGAAPIHRAIMAGETVTGITTMMMDAGLDTGDKLLTEEEPIHPDDTYGSVHDRLAQKGAALLLWTLQKIQEGKCPRQAQDGSVASYAPPVRKEECLVDWTRLSFEVHNQVRGTNPRPGAFCFRKGEMLRIHSTQVWDEPLAGSPGSIHRLPGRRGPVVSCGQGAIELLQVQPAGKKPMSGFDYLLGRPPEVGESLLGMTGQEHSTAFNRPD